MANKPVPYLTAALSLSSNTYSFSSDEAPSLNLTIVSHYSTPITIFGRECSPSLMIRHDALTITDLTTGQIVKHYHATRCLFEPPSKIQVKLNEDWLLELRPEEPVTRSAPFSRDQRPFPKGAPGFGDKDYAYGVDGLEPGHRYSIQLSGRVYVHWSHVRWWEHGTKEEVLRPDENGVSRLNPRKVVFRKGPHGPIDIDISGISPIEFECVE